MWACRCSRQLRLGLRAVGHVGEGPQGPPNRIEPLRRAPLEGLIFRTGFRV